MDFDRIDFSKLTDEQKEKAMAAKTPEEIIAFAKEAGYELSDEQMKAIAGGSWCWDACLRCPGYSCHECPF